LALNATSQFFFAELRLAIGHFIYATIRSAKKKKHWILFFRRDFYFLPDFFQPGFICFFHRDFFPRSAKFCWGAEPSCEIMSQTFLLDATFPDLRATKCRHAMLTFFPGRNEDTWRGRNQPQEPGEG
jgi:hypothetical protein